ncbi:MAG: hypothetical protein WC916_02755 [Candidatus Woesearchaeota archaeon]
MNTALKKINKIDKINLKLEALTQEEHDLKKDLNPLQESISITSHEIEEFYKNISKTYCKILGLDDYYKNKKGFHIHKAQKSKIFNLDDLKLVKSLEDIEIANPWKTSLLKNSIVYSCFKKEQYYASPSILNKYFRRLAVYFPIGLFAGVSAGIECIVHTAPGIIGKPTPLEFFSVFTSFGAAFSTGMISYDLFSNKNTFEYVANQIKTDTLQKSKSINKYLSRCIDPEEFFKQQNSTHL